MKIYPTKVMFKGHRIWIQDNPALTTIIDYQVNTLGNKIVLEKAKDSDDLDYIEVDDG